MKNPAQPSTITAVAVIALLLTLSGCTGESGDVSAPDKFTPLPDASQEFDVGGKRGKTNESLTE